VVGPRWRAVSLRRGDWKLIARSKDKKRSFELYNIAADPSEKQNLSQSEPVRLKDLQQRLKVAAAADNDAVVKQE